MAQIKPMYEVVNEFPVIAQELMNKYPEQFQDIDIAKVRCYSVVNKERKEGAQFFKIQVCPEPFDIDCPYKFGVVVYEDDWVDMPESNRALLVAAILFALNGSDVNGGKVNRPDLKDYSPMIRTFGMDYLTEEVIDIIESDVTWKD